jgi:hypothetical protein
MTEKENLRRVITGRSPPGCRVTAWVLADRSVRYRDKPAMAMAMVDVFRWHRESGRKAVSTCSASNTRHGEHGRHGAAHPGKYITG